MYGLLKGYVSRKPTGDDSNELSFSDEEPEKIHAEQLQNRSVQLQKRTENSGYGRFFSWGIDGMSYLGSQVRSKVDKTYSWWTSQEDTGEESTVKMASTKRSGPRQPDGTTVYTVGGNDTLNKIALLFDTTPSELTRMNKLTSRMLYPGQVLFVPDQNIISNETIKEKQPCNEYKSTTHLPHDNNEKIKLTKKVSLMSDDEEEITETFLKIKAKHITDGQGVVNGVVLLTPHSAIFNPNVSDPLVMDRGRDCYCIKTPMSAITSAALYKDIAAMAIHDPLKSGRFYLDESTRESVSRQNSVDMDSCKTGSPRQEIMDSNVNIQQNNEINTSNGLQEPEPSTINREDSEQTSDHEELVQIANELLKDLISDVVGSMCQDQKPTYLPCSDKTELNTLDKNSISLSPLSEDSGICSPQIKCQIKGTNSLVRQSKDMNKGPLNGCDRNESPSMYTNKGLPESNCDPDTSHDSVMENSVKRQSSFFENLSGDVKYWLGISYRNEDDHAFEEEIIPRPATAYEDNLVYLCLRISKQHWCMCLAGGEGIHSHKDTENVMNRDKQRREHWFAIPSSRIEHVYGFIRQHCPNINRTLSVSEEDQEDDIVDDEEDEAVQYVDGFYSSSPPKPKITSNTETKQVHLTLDINRPSSSTKESVITPDLCDEMMFMPEMSTDSQILSPALIKKLNKNLPSRAVGHGWTLVYSTFTHGFSLKTLYRNMEEFDTPMLIVVQDDQHQVFGVVTSCPLKISEGFYGTGQSFLFKFDEDDIKTFHWQGDNDFFIKGSVDCIAFGGGGGHFGLWIDEDFYHGSSHYSETYRNDALTDQEDFLCSALEAWTFM